MRRPRILIIMAVMILAQTERNGLAQPPGHNGLGGASVPRRVPNQPPPARGQSKRVGQWMLTLILEGKSQQGLQYAEQIREARGDEAEMFFLVALAHGQLGQPEAAETAMNRALELGLPAQRFLAGPRVLLEPLENLNTWRDVRDHFADAILHGPML